MSIWQFVPLAVLILLTLCGLAELTGFVPLAPVAVVTGAALIAIILELEERKLIRIVRQLLDAFREDWIHHR